MEEVKHCPIESLLLLASHYPEQPVGAATSVHLQLGTVHFLSSLMGQIEKQWESVRHGSKSVFSQSNPVSGVLTEQALAEQVLEEAIRLCTNLRSLPILPSESREEKSPLMLAVMIRLCPPG